MSLTFDGVTRAFGSQPALKGLDLHVPDGACYGFLGGNGAGKTTSMRIALGLLAPSSGRVLVDGLDVAKNPTAARARTAGLIEAPGFFPGLSAHRNLLRLAALNGVPARDRRRQVERWLDVVGLSPHAARKAGIFSQGMRQRLGLAQALIGGARNVLLDEPMSGLDPQGIAEIREVLQRLVQDEGRTLLVSSHQLKELEGLCDFVGILHGGRLMLEGPLDQLLRGAEATYRLEARDRQGLTDRLASHAGRVETIPDPGPGVVVKLLDFQPEDLIRDLSQARVGITAFAPRHRGLEAIYLEAIQRPVESVTLRTKVPEPELVAADVAPPKHPFLRALGYEARRATASWTQRILTVLPAGIGFYGVHVYADELELSRAANADVASTSVANAFEGVGEGLIVGLPFLTMILVGLASQSIAGERGALTLKNLLTAPLRRSHAAAAKLTLLVGQTLFSYGLLLGAVCYAATQRFEWTGTIELVANANEPSGFLEYPLVPVEELWPLFSAVWSQPIAPLLAMLGLGFLCSSVTSRAMPALATALGSVVVMELARVPLRAADAEGYLPLTYLPTILGETSRVDVYLSLVRGEGDAEFAFAATEGWLPLMVFAITVALAFGVFFKRRVR